MTTALGNGVGVCFGRPRLNLLNPPDLQVTSGGSPTHAANAGDNLVAAISTAAADAADGKTTTSVEVYDDAGVTLLGSAVNDGGGAWHLNLNAVAAGTHNYVAKRITASGSRFSATWSVVVSSGTPHVVDDSSGNPIYDDSQGPGNDITP
jgi:hypothetical protein